MHSRMTGWFVGLVLGGIVLAGCENGKGGGDVERSTGAPQKAPEKSAETNGETKEEPKGDKSAEKAETKEEPKGDKSAEKAETNGEPKGEKSPEKAPETAAEGPPPGLMDPSKAVEKAPEKFTVKLATTKGDVKLEIHRAWAPLGADRFYNLVRIGFINDLAIFRVMKGFVIQFGIHGDPAVSRVWRDARIKDDPVVESNKRGYITFATAGPNSRTTQVFINLADRNTVLDEKGFSPFGRVVEGMDVIDSIFGGHGQRPNQGLIQSQGNAYLKKSFPGLDYIKSAEIVE